MQVAAEAAGDAAARIGATGLADDVEDLALLGGQGAIGSTHAEGLVPDEHHRLARRAELPVEPGELFGVGAIEFGAGVEVVAVGVGVHHAVLPEVVEVERHEAPAADHAGVIALGHAPRGHRRRLVRLVHVVIAEHRLPGQGDVAPLGQQLLRTGVGVAEVAELPDGIEVAVLRDGSEEGVEARQRVGGEAVMEVGDQGELGAAPGRRQDREPELQHGDGRASGCQELSAGERHRDLAEGANAPNIFGACQPSC